MERQLNTPDVYYKEILYLYGFVISVSRISLCHMVDRTLIIEFVSNMIKD